MFRTLLLATAASVIGAGSAFAQSSIEGTDFNANGGSIAIAQIGGSNVIAGQVTGTDHAAGASGAAILVGVGGGTLTVDIRQVNAAGGDRNRLGVRARTNRVTNSTVTLSQGAVDSPVAGNTMQVDVGVNDVGAPTDFASRVNVAVEQLTDNNTATLTVGRLANTEGSIDVLQGGGTGNTLTANIDRLNGRFLTVQQQGSINTTTLRVGRDTAITNNVTLRLVGSVNTNGNGTSAPNVFAVDGTSDVNVTVTGSGNQLGANLTGGRLNADLISSTGTLSLAQSAGDADLRGNLEVTTVALDNGGADIRLNAFLVNSALNLTTTGGMIRGALVDQDGNAAADGDAFARIGPDADMNLIASAVYTITTGGGVYLSDTGGPAGGNPRRNVVLSNQAGQAIIVYNTGVLDGTLAANTNTGLEAQTDTGLRISQSDGGSHEARLSNTANGTAFNIQQSGAAGAVARIQNTGANAIWYVNQASGATLEGRNSVTGATMSVLQTGAAHQAFLTNTGATAVTINQQGASPNVIGSSAAPAVFDGTTQSVTITQSN